MEAKPAVKPKKAVVAPLNLEKVVEKTEEAVTVTAQSPEKPKKKLNKRASQASEKQSPVKVAKSPTKKPE